MPRRLGSFVSGHGFGRAEISVCTALYQGMALAVPKYRAKETGFSPWFHRMYGFVSGHGLAVPKYSAKETGFSTRFHCMYGFVSGHGFSRAKISCKGDGL
jgi:hypothetical protein